jgi:ComF family protein
MKYKYEKYKTNSGNVSKINNLHRKYNHIAMLQKMGSWILALLWPEVCPFCNSVYRTGICPSCRKKIQKIQIREPRCMQCGKPVRRMEQEYCYDCAHMRHSFDQGLSVWLHRPPVNQSIYQFKYHNQRRYGLYYGKELMSNYQAIVKKWQPDVIIPIPLHKRRRRKRGYNQAQILAEYLGKELDIPTDSRSLVRRIYTEPQKELNHAERKKNLRGAFALRKDFHPVPVVLLIDDIYTTGSTIDAAAKVLKERGVQKVCFLTISIGQGM